jgi:hypothetical protein
MAPYGPAPSRKYPRHRCGCGKGNEHVGLDPAQEAAKVMLGLFTGLESELDGNDGRLPPRWITRFRDAVSQSIAEARKIGVPPHLKLLPQKAGEKKK